MNAIISIHINQSNNNAMALYIRITDNTRAGGNAFLPLKDFVDTFPEEDKVLPDEVAFNDIPVDETLWSWVYEPDLREDGDTYDDYMGIHYEIIEQG